MVTKRRKLSDLFATQVPLTLDDKQGDPQELILRKLSPVDEEKAFRRANAARATIAAAKKNKESDEYQDVLNSFVDFETDEIVDILANGELAKQHGALEAELAEANGWMEDDYLQGLSDAWEDTLEAREKEEPDDPDVVRVKAELERFSDEVKAKRERELAAIKDDLRLQSEEKLLAKLIDTMLTVRANNAWDKEFSRCEIWLCSRYADDGTRVFKHRHEVDELHRETIDQYLLGLSELQIEVAEGKDSPEIPASSTSSEQSETEEMEPSSGQETVTA